MCTNQHELIGYANSDNATECDNFGAEYIPKN